MLIEKITKIIEKYFTEVLSFPEEELKKLTDTATLRSLSLESVEICALQVELEIQHGIFFVPDKDLNLDTTIGYIKGLMFSMV